MKGTGVALVTPFNSDFTIDFDALAKLVEHCINGGLEYLVVLGTTGEGPTLTKEEKKQVFAFVAKQVAGRIPLVAGIGGNDTMEVIETMKSFDANGYTMNGFVKQFNQSGTLLNTYSVGLNPNNILFYD